MKQTRLGRSITGLITVIIEMIATQIGQYRNVEIATVDTILFERVRRHLHDHILATLLAKLMQAGLQSNDIRGGQTVRRQLVADAVAQSADAGAGFADARQGLGQQMGDAGLAIGASDANDGHRLRRITKKPADDVTVGTIELIDADPTSIDLLTQQRNSLQAVLVSSIINNGARTRLDCIDGVVDSI